MWGITKPFGQKAVYFPNLIFKLVRSARLMPNQAAFKVPLHVNKLDIRDYLKHLYNVNVLDVRTVIYPGKLVRNRRTLRMERTARVKKAIVTLDHDFKYPALPKPEEFGEKGHRLQEKVSMLKLSGWRVRSPVRAELREVLTQQMKEQSPKE
ncbi:mitochondrial 54S ribosomal protein YmL41 [Dispira parvispora]|uniref:Large ribosomal subunit protein uL23m n=1 Tax=Dispira parvispora TaxID=1520584 RepID=A0A9W8E4S5_9FUNG|nr:mitochondrial 54S ribosomal protein YmL41 [Dispira parvispora]